MSRTYRKRPDWWLETWEFQDGIQVLVRKRSKKDLALHRKDGVCDIKYREYYNLYVYRPSRRDAKRQFAKMKRMNDIEDMVFNHSRHERLFKQVGWIID